MSEKTGVAGVPHLIVMSGPSAIPRRIATIVVLSLYGIVKTRPRPHVGQEVLKRISPAITHLNSATAIVLVSSTIGIGASLNHAIPGIVLRRMASTLGGSMPSEPKRRKLTL